MDNWKMWEIKSEIKFKLMRYGQIIGKNDSLHKCHKSEKKKKRKWRELGEMGFLEKNLDFKKNIDFLLVAASDGLFWSGHRRANRGGALR